MRDFAPGDAVLAIAESGGYAEMVSVAASQCYKLPSGLSFVDAAAMAVVFDTAWFALRDRARLAPGETVLVLGASGAIGHACVQLAKAFGARVLAGVSSPEKFEAARAAGADVMIDLSQPDLHDSLREQVRAATGGRGADIVLDPVGGDVFDAAIRALAWRGRLVVIGFAERPHSDDQGELSHGQEYRSERPANQRLSQAHGPIRCGMLGFASGRSPTLRWRIPHGAEDMRAAGRPANHRGSLAQPEQVRSSPNCSNLYAPAG